MVHRWNQEEGLNQLDKYFHHSDEYLKAGACLGVGMICSGVKGENDPALALLCEYFEPGVNPSVRMASIISFGLAYAGSQREDIKEMLEAIVINSDSHNIAEASLAALALGFVFSGSCHDDISR